MGGNVFVFNRENCLWPHVAYPGIASPKDVPEEYHLWRTLFLCFVLFKANDQSEGILGLSFFFTGQGHTKIG